MLIYLNTRYISILLINRKESLSPIIIRINNLKKSS